MSNLNVNTTAGDTRDPLYRKKHAGLPGNGGQTAAHERDEAGRSLITGNGAPTLADKFVVAQREKIEQKAQRLMDGGYAPAISLVNPAGIDGSYNDRKDWMDVGVVTAEYADEGIPVMTYDQNKNLTGRVNRGWHHGVAAGQPVKFRMPSKTGFNAWRALNERNGVFAAQRANGDFPTMDFPVEVQGPSGNTVMGHVRVSDLGNGQFSVSPIGMEGKYGIAAAEAVRAMAESRRSSGSIRRAGDLIERALGREDAQGVEMVSVQSKWMKGVGYDAKRGKMYMEASGKVYEYDASPEEFRSFVTADSAGHVFHQIIGRGRKQIKSSTAHTDRCTACKYVKVPGVGHRCRNGLHAAPTREAAEFNATPRARAMTVLEGETRQRRMAAMRPVRG